MMKKITYAFAICLLGLGLMQSANATIVYSSTGAVPGSTTVPGTLAVAETFLVEAGMEYKATLTDVGIVLPPVIDNFDGLSMAILDDAFGVVDTLALTPTSGDGLTSAMFSFTALTDATYNVVIGGITDSISTYAATISKVDGGVVIPDVPLPASAWFLGTAMFGLLITVGRRKKV